MKRWLGHILKILLVVAIFIYLAESRALKFDNLKAAIRRLDLFAVAVLLILGGALMTVQRWRLLLRGQNIALAMWPAVKLTWVGYFFSMALPGTISGDFVKAYYIAKGERQKALLVTSIFFDRLLGLYAVIAIAALTATASLILGRVPNVPGSAAQPVILSLELFIIGLLVTMTLLGWILAHPKFRGSAILRRILARLPFRGRIGQVFEAFHQFTREPRSWLPAFALSLAANATSYVGLFVLARLLGAGNIRGLAYFFVLPISMLTMAIPLAPSGLGVGEIGFSRVFLLFGSDKGAEVAVLYHIIFFTVALVGGSLIYVLSDFAKRKIQAPPSLERSAEEP